MAIKHIVRGVFTVTESHWDDRFLELAKHISGWSKDGSTKVGCVVVGTGREIISIGYNGFPRGVSEAPLDRHQRPVKYQFTEHAERNALYNALRSGAAVYGSTLYCTHPPCTDCARGIIQSGIVQVYCGQHSPAAWERWKDDFALSVAMFDEAGVGCGILEW